VASHSAGERAFTWGGCGRVQSRARRIIISSTRARTAWFGIPFTPDILAAAATAALEARAIAFAGLALVIIGFWIKARLEERFLRNELGAEVYDANARRTGMLFPGL
jgi:hypothetical protein